jgi:hypothetical protein
MSNIIKARIVDGFIGTEKRPIKLAFLVDYFIVGHGETPSIAKEHLGKIICGNIIGNKKLNQPFFHGIHSPPAYIIDKKYEEEYSIDINQLMI